MTALKVGDRVHVEYDAELIRLHYADGMAQVEYGDFTPIVPASALTKLPDPEPEWALGDVILVGGERVYVHDPAMTFCAWRGIDGDAAPRKWVSEQWADGDVQRLVPEAQK